MVFSIGGYSLVFGVPFAAGIVGQIALHESGHALAMRQLKIPFLRWFSFPFSGPQYP
jgi:hypothetical protein